MTFDEANSFLVQHGIESTMMEPERQFLFERAQARVGQRALEIGTAYGGTSVLLAMAGMHVDTVDNWQCGERDRCMTNLAHLDAATRQRITVHDMPSAEFHRIRVFPARLQYGLLLVDGDHTGDTPYLDIMAFLPHLTPGAIFCVDDMANGYPAITVGAIRAIQEAAPYRTLKMLGAFVSSETPCHTVTKMMAWEVVS